MDAAMIKLDLIPTWAYWLVIAGAAAVIGAQQVHVAGLKTDVAAAGTALATEQKGRADERSMRFALALDHAEQIKRLLQQHALGQQITEEKHAEKIRGLEADKRAGAATAGRLRDAIAAYAASGGRVGETDAAAVERYAHRLGIVSGLLTESVDLVTESRDVVGQRDAEVRRLLDQIALDRAACKQVQVFGPQNK